MINVAIIGGGASGMMAALTAAEDGNNRVVLFERQQRVGRKLLATGNGRCNLTNTGACAENYHGSAPEFAAPALKKFPPDRVLEFFGALGLLTAEEYGGRVYPFSNSANSVVDVLRFALERRGVELRASTPVRLLKRSGEKYILVTDDGDFDFDRVVVACGGAAGAKLGGVTDGYELLKSLGHRRTALYPALVQLLTDTDYPRSLKGVRAEVSLSLLRGEELLKHSRGELQFTDTGVSGPAAFDISRSVCGEGEDLSISIDFFRDFSLKQVSSLLAGRRAAFPALEAGELFTGMLHNRLGRMLVKYAGLSAQTRLAELDDAALSRAAYAGKYFRLRVTGTEGFDSAQVTAGGVKVSGFNPETLESWFMPGLFVCGEVLDIDGDCGGYNLQWAWASGRLAGRLGK